MEEFMSTKKQKSCPFCGRPSDVLDNETLYPNGLYWRIEDGIKHYISFEDRKSEDNKCWTYNCPVVAGGCGAEIYGDSRDECIEKWNTRV